MTVQAPRIQHGGCPPRRTPHRPSVSARLRAVTVCEVNPQPLNALRSAKPGAGDCPRLAMVMGLIGALWALPALTKAAPLPHRVATAELIEPFASLIDEASQRFAVPPLWVRLVMQVESAGDARALSSKGAIGLMQIMPATYSRLRETYGLSVDPFNPRDNILAGAAYLRELYDRYGAPGFLAAYNAGPGRYEDHVATGRPLPEETRLYLARLTPMVAGVQAERSAGTSDPLAWRHAPLFVSRA
jgi:soluble lytic murein transglycosylase-like protein